MKLEISNDSRMHSILYDAEDIPSRRSVGVIYNAERAQFVVRACNAHKGLVKALEEIVKNDPYNVSSAGIIAREALAAAKGEM